MDREQYIYRRDGGSSERPLSRHSEGSSRAPSGGIQVDAGGRPDLVADEVDLAGGIPLPFHLQATAAFGPPRGPPSAADLHKERSEGTARTNSSRRGSSVSPFDRAPSESRDGGSPPVNRGEDPPSTRSSMSRRSTENSDAHKSDALSNAPAPSNEAASPFALADPASQTSIAEEKPVDTRPVWLR